MPVLIVLAATMLLSACSTPKLFDNTKNNIHEVNTQIDDARQKEEAVLKPNASVIVKDELYVDFTPIDLNTQPTWLNNPISLHGDKLPFSFYANNIVRSANVITTYQQRLDPTGLISMDYTGTMQGALDMLAAKTGFVYTIFGNTVFWEAYVTKTFNIAFMPGSSQYLVGKDNTTSNAVSSETSGDNTIVKQGSDASYKNQYSNLQAKLSVWSDMKDTIESLLSKEGQVVISESTTTITVTDHPSNVKNIARYIDETNINLSKQVMIKVQVLQINLQENFSNGINWDVAKTMLRGTDFTFSGNFAAPISIAPIAGISNASFGAANGASQALINALSQQGRISTTTEPTVVTTNNQVASLSITTQTGYLARVSTTATDAAATTELIPGQVNAGLTLFLLPKIMDNKIYLQVSSSLSSLQQIQNIYATGSDESQKIQAPVINDNTFNQRSVIVSGSTLILAGFKQVQNEANNSAFANINALGGRGAATQNVETLILITPYILTNE